MDNHFAIIWDGRRVASYEEPEFPIRGHAELENIGPEMHYDDILVCEVLNG